MTSWASRFQFRASKIYQMPASYAEVRQEQCHCGVGVLVDVILNAYWEPLDFELPILLPHGR
ncbi:MAG TPA: hypothetical protein VK335_30475 [Bryobacteraceae bacterium]|nr:hypothetical protein [Bryobacteraceae bacterium]HZW94734.1 hypothetical protein [Candidatus Eremiobacteraceae bacterium]